MPPDGVGRLRRWPPYVTFRHVSPAEALIAIPAAVRAGRHRESQHAVRRMRERGVTIAGLRRAIGGVTTCAALADDRWRLEGGADQDGDSLTVVCVIDDDGVVTVTLF